MNPFVLLFDFRGRINRAKFWLAALIYILFLFGMTGLVFAVTDSFASVIAVSLLAYVVLLVSGAAIAVKRLHDRNKSARWLVLVAVPVVLPMLVAIFIDPFEPDPPMAVVALQYVSLAISVWAVIELGCLRGTIGTNRYGPDPLLPGPAVARAR